MMKRKRVLSLMLAFVMTLLLASCGGETGEKTSQAAGSDTTTTKAEQSENAHVVIKIGIEGSESGNDHKIATKIKELVEADPEANIKVQVFGDSQLGNLRDLIEGLSLNTVGMVLGGLNGFENICPNMGVYTPWMIDSPEQAIELYESEVGVQLQNQLINENGIRLLSYCNAISGSTYLWGNKPCKTLADYDGLDIRSNNSAGNIKALGAFGANPVVMGFADVYNGIETGLIDMTWGSIPVVITGGLGEVLDYVMPAPANFTAGTCAVSNQLWDSMSAYQQETVQKAVAEACQVYGKELYEAGVAAEEAMLKEAGIEYVEMNESDYQEMCTLVADAIFAHLSETCDADVLAAVREVVTD